MAGTTSVSSRSRDVKQAEDVSLGSTTSSDPQDCNKTQGGPDIKLDSAGDDRIWTLVCPSGNSPHARFYHSAAVIGRRMLVVGGDSDHGMLNDVQQLHLGKLSWSTLEHSTKIKATQQQLPLCRGHSLIAWGQKLLLITGETDPPMETVAIWSFDMEKENWSKVEAKGELPVVRTGHSVTRAGSVLILFGGEDVKGRKLNDLHMFDLKSSMWLPLLAMGSIPSPRSKHVAAIYDDRLLLVFGGTSKSKYLNDLYALDFEAMEWSRLKTRGVSAGSRAGSAGVLFNDNWYIVGGESNGARCLETIMLDVARMTWSVVAQSNIHSPSASQGFSMVLARRKERAFLVAFGGKRPGSASEVEVLYISAQEHMQTKSPTGSSGWIMGKEPFLSTNRADQSWITVTTPVQSLISDDSGALPLHQRSPQEESSPSIEEQSVHTTKITEALLPLVSEKDMEEDVVIDTGQTETSESKLLSLADVKASFEKKLALSLKRNSLLEGQLKTVGASRDDTERSLAMVIKSKQKVEKRLAVSLKENEDLKAKLAAAESAQDESMNLTNIVHAENLRLDHDLAFLKAVLEDTQKELQTTRGVLSGERSRAFQLQVELFELKQTIQTLQINQNE